MKKEDLLVYQRYSPAALGVLVVALTVLPALSMDMYLPALPSMTESFGTTDAMVNATIYVYNTVFAICIVLFGVLADKYGRRPVILMGLTVYLIACILSSMANSIHMLIITRAFMGVGSGAGSVVSMSLIKDCYPEEKRITLLMAVQIGFVVAPILAPVIGGQILRFFSWRATFIGLAVVAVILLICCAFLKESLTPEMTFHGTVAGSIKNMVLLLKKRSFTLLLLTSSIFAFPFMAYITCSSYIYEDLFGLSAQMYSLFFAGASLATVISPLILTGLRKVMSLKRITYLVIIIIICVAVLVLFVGGKGPAVFFGCMVPFYVAHAVMRPYITNLVLSQYSHDTGVVSSWINFGYTGIGVLGMLAVSLPWSGYIVAFGCCTLLAGFLALGFWIALMRKPQEIIGLND